MIIEELVTTEEHYVRDLQALCSVFVDPLDPKLDPVVSRLTAGGGPNAGGPNSLEASPSSKRRTLSIMGRSKGHKRNTNESPWSGKKQKGPKKKTHNRRQSNQHRPQCYRPAAHTKI